jgi:predicted ATPase
VFSPRHPAPGTQPPASGLRTSNPGRWTPPHLAARIDRLPAEEKELLQTLAVIGKEFSFSLLERVVDQPEEQLHGLLAHLQTGEFIYEQPAFPEPEYVFKHALTQEVAYNSLLLERRRVLHERTAQALEDLFPARLEDHYSELAYHYSRSGNTQRAVEYLRLAGQQAGERSAYAEATEHFTAALELLKTLPDTPARDQRELALQLARGPALGNSKGYIVPELEQVYTRARELCQQVGEPSQLFTVILELRTFYHLRGQLQAARELGEQLLGLAQQMQNAAFLMLAHRALGATLCSLGELASARVHLEQSLALYDPQQHRADDILYGQAPLMLGFGYLAWTLWSLGYPAQALEKTHVMFAAPQELFRPASLAAALGSTLRLHLYRRERYAAQERAEALIALCTEHEFPNWMSWGIFARGWILAEQGQVEEGILHMRQVIADDTVSGGLWTQSFLALLAEVYGKAAQVEEGLNTLAEASATVDKTGERYYEAELYRLKGELTLQKFKVQGSEFQVTSPQSPTPSHQAEAEAEACFLKAIDIARRQQAKSLELRAVMSLSRLWQQQGKKDAARQMLADIYNWFTEGFDTADLKDASVLLEQLSSDSPLS